MAEMEEEPEEFLESHIHLIVHWFLSRKRKLQLPDAVPMQCPNKHASGEGAMRFSQRLESVRKDVECTFGILKKRWRILKNHMLIHKKARIDNMVFTCAVLHNMLLVHDEWDDEDDDYDIAADIPENNMDRRIINLRQGPVDHSYVGGGNIADHDIEVESDWSTLRTDLIDHYMHCFKQHCIDWL